MAKITGVRKFSRYRGNNVVLSIWGNLYTNTSTAEDRAASAETIDSFWWWVRENPPDGVWDEASFPTGNIATDEFISTLVHQGSDAPVVNHGDYEVLTYLDMKVSSSTIGWFGMQDARVPTLTLTKGKQGNNRPKEPVRQNPRRYFGKAPAQPEPVVLSVIPPSQHAGEGLSEFQLRLEKWSAAKKQREERISAVRMRKYHTRIQKHTDNVEKSRRLQAAYDRAYADRYAKYVAKVVDYDDMMAKALRPHYLSGSARFVPPDNPFSRLTIEPIGELRYSYSWDLFNRYNWEFADPSGTAIPVDILNTRRYTTSELLTREKEANQDDIWLSLHKQLVTAAERHVQHIDEKLTRKFHGKLKKSAVHVGNLIAERKQSYDLIANSLTRIVQLVKLKKQIFRKAGQYLSNPNAIANDVLAFKFGVEPLINDIKSAIEYIDSSEDNPLITTRVNSGGPEKLVFSDADVTFEGTVEISYVLKCRVVNPAARALSQFGLINPLEIAWEVLPWSFVIDWVFPVGQWLSNQTADCGLELITGTRKLKLVGVFNTVSQPSSLTNPNGSASVHGEFLGKVIERTVLTDLPKVPFPVVKNPWSWSHGIEAAALAVQKLRKTAPTH